MVSDEGLAFSIILACVATRPERLNTFDQAFPGKSLPRTFANFGILSLAEIVSKLLTFAAIFYLARVLGAGGLGDVEFAAAVAMWAGLVVDLGLGPYGAREIARDPASTSSHVAEVVAARIVLALLACGVVAMVAWRFAPTPAAGRLLWVYAISLLPTPLLLGWVFQGHDAMGVVAAATVARQLGFAAVVFACVRGPADGLYAGVAETVGVTLCAGVGVACYVRRFQAWPRLFGSISPRLLREGGAIGASQMFWAARMYGGIVLLRYVARAEDVGYYAAASRILLAAHTFVWLYYFNLLPTMSRAWHAGRAALAAVVAKSMRHVAVAAAICGAAWVFLAPLVVRLAYGVEFAPAAGPLQWFAGVCVAAAISGHYRYGLIAAGRQSAEMLIQAGGALVTAIAIPLGDHWAGPAGAAAGLAASELVIWLCAWLAFRAMSSAPRRVEDAPALGQSA